MSTQEPAYEFDRNRFAKMLERVIKDKEFGTRLQKRPLLTVMESGFDLHPDLARKIEDRTLTEIIDFDPFGPVANVAVSVAIDAGVAVVIRVGVHTRAADPMEEVINPVIRDRIVDIVEERVQMTRVLATPPLPLEKVGPIKGR